MASVEKKQEADLSPDVDSLEPKAESLAKAGKLDEALEQVLAVEKKARNVSAFIAVSGYGADM